MNVYSEMEVELSLFLTSALNEFQPHGQSARFLGEEMTLLPVPAIEPRFL